MTTTTKTRITEPLPGYLHATLRRGFGRRERPILLMAACPCGKWHTHGAGTVERPHDYPPGTVVGRATHCLTYDYTEVRIETEPFRAAWSTPRGWISTAYRTTRPLGCPRCNRFAAEGDLGKPKLGICSTPDCSVVTWDRPTGVTLTTI